MTDESVKIPSPVYANAVEHVRGPWTPRQHIREKFSYTSAESSVAGPAYTIRLRRAANRSNANVVNTLTAYDMAPAGSVVVVQVMDDVGGAVVGDIIAHRLKQLGVVGVVVEGPVRDLVGLKEFGPPVWYREAVTTGLEMAETEAEMQVELEVEGVTITPGMMVTADQDGVFLMPLAQQDEILERAHAVMAREERVHAALQQGENLVHALGFASR